MPTVITQGAASAKGYGFGARATAANYIEDVFSTYLYTGTGGSQTITNGIDLSTKGGMVWIKSRSDATNNFLFDTARGSQKEINSNTTDAEVSLPYSLGPFNTNGFTIGNATGIGVGAATYASWTFRKQAKFFDVVTYTGNGVSGRTISHNLGSAPGCIIIKSTSTAGEYWAVYHRSIGATKYLWLQDTIAASTSSTYWNDTSPTSSVFSVGNDGSVNGNGKTYVAYLFAHDAGGFGATGTDNVISCGSFTSSGSDIATIDLGYEPQLVIMKASSTTGHWWMADNMRGFTVSGEQYLLANSSGAEASGTNIRLTNTGFYQNSTTGSATTYIYIAIRRGPMKTPTTGTSVFSPIASSAATGTKLTTNFPVDFLLTKYRSGAANNAVVDRLRGVSTNATEKGSVIYTNSTAAESGTAGESLFWDNTGFQVPSNWGGPSNVYEAFRRAPGFFDVACYTGDGVAGRTITHNLGSAPELMIIKSRNNSANWAVYHGEPTKYMFLNSTNATTVSSGYWNDTAPTASVFTVGGVGAVNVSAAYTYVAYLFATVAGVSKVGSYTGTGTTNQINCGFTGGARFVLIKRTDSTGDWYVWDSARGIVAGNDSYLLLNSTAAEVTNTDYVDTYSAGFEISSTAPAAINANGGSFIFFAVA